MTSKAPKSGTPLTALPPVADAPFGTIDAGKLIGKATGDALAAALPPLLAETLGETLVPVLLRVVAQAVPPRVCATCLASRVSWEKANRTALSEAMAAAQKQAITAGQDPGQADFAPFLPERLRGSVPNVNTAITTCQGTDVCAEHVPGVQGGTPLLIAQGNVPPGALS